MSKNTFRNVKESEKVWSILLSWFALTFNEVYTGLGASSKVMLKSFQKFLCNPVDKPTNQPTTQMDTGKYC